MVPASIGEITQLATMDSTLLQATASMEIPTAAKPTMAPTIEWVVETGQPKTLAINSQVPAASSADNMPYTNSSGESTIAFESIIPCRIVAVKIGRAHV